MDSNVNHGVFDASNIYTYWKDQEVDSSGKFVDSIFPPNERSILGQDSKGNWIDSEVGPQKSKQLNLNDIEWKRASEIFSKYLIFDDKIEFDDIKQGNLGNCYFLCAIAAMTEFPILIHQIFRTKEVNDNGYYEIVLFIDGEWQVVVLDDYFPVKKGTKELAFSKPNGFELWVILLEKAWAKINGGYANIISGWPDEPLLALTGFASHKYDHAQTEEDDLWKVLLEAEHRENIMCSSTKNEVSIANYNLVVNHAYSLISAKETYQNGERIRLVKLRNPWGYKEWNGDWGDDSPLWTEATKSYYGMKVGDDGTFFMSIKDFRELFSSTHICYVMHNSNIKSFMVTMNNNSSPNVLNLFMESEGRISISALFKHWRYNRNLKKDNHPCTLMIARYNQNIGTFSEVDGEYSATDSVEVIKSLSRGFYVIWIYCHYESCKDPKPDKFNIRFISPVRYKIRHVNQDNSFMFIREILAAGIREKYLKDIDGPIFYKVENMFKRTGLGYRCILNDSPTDYQKWTNDASGLQNFALLPPFDKANINQFDLWVPPSSYGIILGMRTAQWGTYWFNVNSTYFSYNCKAGEQPCKKQIWSINDFIETDLVFDEVTDDYYDYVSTDVRNAKKTMKFTRINAKAIAFEELMKEHSDLMHLIIDINPIPEDDSLDWTKQVFDNGFYIGQINSDRNRHGRGVFYWTSDKSCYAGYYSNNVKDKWGKYLNAELKTIYEGGYLNGNKSGHGVWCFNNGDRYEGIWEDDKRHGTGVYIWKDGSKWDGIFVKGAFNGKGWYYPESGDPWEVEYVNGQIAK
jgi:hypothetical protein